MIRIGVIGWGYWGPNLGRNVAASSAGHLQGVADHSAEHRHRAGLAHPGVELWPSGESLLSDPRIDAVVIATPVHTHFQLALAALRAGKHVLLEKPLAGTSEQALALIEESARRGLVLMVDHTFVYSPPVQAVRELLDTGALGPPLYYDSARLGRGIVRSDVNVLWDVATHDLALLDYLFPLAPVTVQAIGTSPDPGGVAHLAWLTLSYDTGFLAHVTASWISPVKVRRVVIGGAERTLVYDDLAPAGRVTLFEDGRPTSTPPLDRTEPLSEVIREFTTSIASGAAPRSDGAAGLRVLRLLEAADLSMREDGRIVELNPEAAPA